MKLDAKLNACNKSFLVAFNGGQSFNAAFESVQIVTDTSGIDIYRGSYEATPTVDGFSMATEKKYMTENVRIKAIPFFDVGNTAGGSTVYIADEID